MKRFPIALVFLISALLLVPVISVTAGSPPALGRALIVQDSAPWGGLTSNQQALTAGGVSYDIITSTQLAANPGIIFSYHMVVFPSDQATSYYNKLKSISSLRALLLKYVISGHNVVIHGTDEGWAEGYWTGIGPFFPLTLDVTHVQFYDGTNHVVGTDRVLTGIPVGTIFNGNFASHDYFTSLPATATTLIENSANNTTYFVWSMGAGRVYASCMTLEFYYGGTYTVLLNNEMYYAGR
jgi:hypothetical protein